MLKNRPFLQAARKNSRGGFTLVELLVVIGIIAILAGVAMGPITNGLKKAKQNTGMQNARSIGLCEFQYSIDNDTSYPDGASAEIIAQKLLAGKYISDPVLFYIAGGAAVKYTGGNAAQGIANANISYDFMGQGATPVGLNTNAPDQLPVVWSTGITFNLPAAATGTAVAATFANNPPYGTDGVAVCYHSNSAFFKTSTVSGSSYSVANFIDQSFDPGGTTYLIRTSQ